MSLQVMLITILLPGRMAEEMLSLRLKDLEKVSEHKTSDVIGNQVKRIDDPYTNAYHYPAEPTTHGIGYGHHLHPFYYQGKTTTYDCALQGEWHPIVPGPEMDFGINEDNTIRNQPLLNAKYNTYINPFSNYWNDLQYNPEFPDQNSRAYDFNNYYPQVTKEKLANENQQYRTDNSSNFPSAHNKKITTYLTPPPFSINANWRHIFSVPQEKSYPAKVMDLITALHNLKIIPLLEEEDDL